MENVRISLYLRADLVRQIDEIAKQQSRSRSAVIREAISQYIERRENWEELFEYGSKTARENGLSEQDIEKEIAAYRKEKRT